MEQQSPDDGTSIYNMVSWIFSANWWDLLLRKKYSFQIILLTDNDPAHPGALMERDNEMNVVFMAADTTSILQPTDQSEIPTFKSYYLRNTYHNAKTVYHKQWLF